MSTATNTNKETIRDHEAAINNQDLLSFFEKSPGKVIGFKENDKKSVVIGLEKLAEILATLTPFVRKIKAHLEGGITEKTKFSACFLLYHRVWQSWEAIKLLAIAGHYQESMELVRSARESLDLANLFVFENDEQNLNAWFAGEIIPNSTAREKFEEILNASQVLPKAIKARAVQASVYHGFSNYTHSGYAAMLESVDIFRKDFDLEKTASYHRLHEALPTLEQLLDSFRLSLITYYLVAKSDITNAKTLRSLDVGPAFSPQEIVDTVEKKYGMHGMD